MKPRKRHRKSSKLFWVVVVLCLLLELCLGGLMWAIYSVSGQSPLENPAGRSLPNNQKSHHTTAETFQSPQEKDFNIAIGGVFKLLKT